MKKYGKNFVHKNGYELCLSYTATTCNVTFYKQIKYVTSVDALYFVDSWQCAEIGQHRMYVPVNEQQGWYFDLCTGKQPWDIHGTNEEL